MAEATIQAALMERVESLPGSLPIAWPGVPFDTPSTDFLRVTHMRAEPSRTFVTSADPLERFGLLQIDLFTVVTAGSHQIKADTIADQIITHFPRGLSLASGRLWVMKSWALPGRRDQDGAHWQTPIRVTYRGAI